MIDPGIIAIAREKTFTRVAARLGIKTRVPSTKANPLLMDAYLGIARRDLSSPDDLSERVAALEEAISSEE
jgi:hypothetical protein